MDRKIIKKCILLGQLDMIMGKNNSSDYFMLYNKID